MKKILVVFGTRPEAIKMAPLVKELERHQTVLESKVCVSGQHREMLDQVLRLFEIIPQYDLDIMKPGQDLFDVTSKVLLGMREVLRKFKPDVVLVHGDTTTAMAASLAAFYEQIPVGHVEAGLRTHNTNSPWPEEVNRQMIDRIAKFLFVPTQANKLNLDQELQSPLELNSNNHHVVVTGNTVIDALFLALDKIEDNKALKVDIIKSIQANGYPNITTLGHPDLPELMSGKVRRLVLITGHRRESFGQGFVDMCEAMKAIADAHPDVDLVYPVHLNPNVRKPVHDILADVSNIYLIEPLEYLPFVYMMNHAHFILTDSGGVQEEAPGLGKPVLVMRNNTERPEGVDAGTVKLVGTDKSAIIRESNLLLDDSSSYAKMAKSHNPYGDGTACSKIVDYLIKIL
jgi:UDP-N-acetylglucosamine 2-epimerase (non-hydrolysing)